ncbi:hypothetical protein ACIBI9_57055 [Nonomuraea sp. NPDC050451]|uniref:hypothetical protein n=1 Tax=Nonomuraea sp. NPDC050451 TaxID=3364364 RepID=UPI00379545C8
MCKGLSDKDDEAASDFAMTYRVHERDDVLRRLSGAGDEAFLAHKRGGFPLKVEVNVRISNGTVRVAYEYDSDDDLTKSEAG